jgi:Cd2+/Zn2+-exporting ATPase
VLQAAELVQAQEQQGRTVVVLGDERSPFGLIAIADTVRPEAAAAVAKLKQLGVARVVLLTGDNRHAAGAIGAALGVDEISAELLPHEKVAVINKLQERYGAVAMVGDGVNDAPALATARLGVAMGAAGTDVALESADVLLMGDDLSRLPAALHLARRARRIVRQNLAFAFTVMLILMALAILGSIPLPLGVVGHEGSTLLVVANGLRLLIRRSS